MPSDRGHRGSSFDEFLKEEGLYEVTQAAAVKRVIVELLDEGMNRESLSKPMMARRMGTSRSQLDRVLDPGNTTIQLDTLIKAARAVGRELRIGFGPRLRGEVASGKGRR
jgi:predicted thioesterase